MLRLSLEECAHALGATCRGDGAAVVVVGVGIDTRAFRPGALYAAIRGERFDGHDFIAEAEHAGAAAVLVERAVETTRPQLIVADVRAALGTLARHWRRRHRAPLIAITGSNGKTTVKETLAAILAEAGPVLATRGNLNNDLGVPLTLFELGPEHRHAVVEMGANAPGEIATLGAIAEPDIGVITNIGPAHLDGFGSLDGVARAKSELFAALGAGGVAVFDADDAFADTLRAAAAHCERCTFGVGASADVRGIARSDALSLHIDIRGEHLAARFALDGEHNRRNALAAVTVAHRLGLSHEAIAAGLASVRPVPGRLQRVTARTGATLIDDSYNANPASVRAALDVLAAQGGTRHLVLGDMAELGGESRALHADIGAAAHALGVEALWTTGPLAEAARHAWQSADSDARGGHYDDVGALIAALAPCVDANTTVLVKGSRSARMERVVAALRDGVDAEGAAP